MDRALRQLGTPAATDPQLTHFQRYLQWADAVFERAQADGWDLTNQDNVLRLSAALHSTVLRHDEYYAHLTQNSRQFESDLNVLRSARGKPPTHIPLGFSSPVLFMQALWSLRLLRQGNLSDHQTRKAYRQLDAALGRISGLLIRQRMTAHESDSTRMSHYHHVNALVASFKTDKKQSLMSQFKGLFTAPPPSPSVMSQDMAEQLANLALNALIP